jgi:hypothetical protein
MGRLCVQAQRVAAKADRETLTELQLRSALRSTSLAAVSKSRRTSKDVTLKVPPPLFT